MADDAHTVKVTVEFTHDEMDMMQRAASDMAPEDYFRGVTLDVARAALYGEADPYPELDEEAAGEPEEIGEPLLGGGPLVALIERIDALERQQDEMLAWIKTIATQLYAHTDFASEEDERKQLRKAADLLKKQEEKIQAWLAKSGDVH